MKEENKHVNKTNKLEELQPLAVLGSPPSIELLPPLYLGG